MMMIATASRPCPCQACHGEADARSPLSGMIGLDMAVGGAFGWGVAGRNIMGSIIGLGRANGEPAWRPHACSHMMMM
jgi:hypothetical protein